jgi:chemotaxis protein MotB
MNYAPARPQIPSPQPLTFNDTSAAFDDESETGSGAGQQDAWLVSFIDILILLLALFVLLLTHQQDGTGPMEKASQGTADPLIETVATTQPFRLALEPPVLLSAPDTLAGIFNIEDELAVPSLAGANNTEAVDINPPQAEPVSAPEMPSSSATDDTVQSIEPLTTADAGSLDVTPAALQEDQSKPAAETNDTRLTNPDPMQVFLDSFNNSELRDRVEVSVNGGGVNLEISDRILFTPANAALTASGMAVLEGLAGALKAQPHLLSIEGHTDNCPIETARFPSNWELSTARAAIVARHLVKQGIPAERIRAIGYADTRPRADNQTPEGRSRNRRVSLLLQVPAGHH